MLERCRLCGSDKLRLWMTDGRNCDLNYYKCSDCSLWNYDLSLGMGQEQYVERYVSPLNDRFKTNVHSRQTWKFLSRYAPVPGRILDIGCGNGCLLHLARQAGWRVQGMELSEKAARAIREDQNIDVTVADFLDYDNSRHDAYDVVVLRHVLEHLPDSLLAMQKVRGLLKDGGFALLEFPNTRSLGYGIKRVLKNRGLRNRKFHEDWRPGHCNEFCRRSFEYLLEQSGFELMFWQTYSNKPLANMIYGMVPVGANARALIVKKPTHARH